MPVTQTYPASRYEVVPLINLSDRDGAGTAQFGCCARLLQYYGALESS